MPIDVLVPFNYMLLRYFPFVSPLSLSSVGSRPRWRMGNKELSQLWKWSDQNPVHFSPFVLMSSFSFFFICWFFQFFYLPSQWISTKVAIAVILWLIIFFLDIFKLFLLFAAFFIAQMVHRWKDTEHHYLINKPASCYYTHGIGELMSN